MWEERLSQLWKAVKFDIQQFSSSYDVMLLKLGKDYTELEEVLRKMAPFNGRIVLVCSGDL